MPSVPHEKQVKRFIQRLDTTSSPTGCWLWTGCRHHQGYGRIGWLGTVTKTHRVAYTLFIGPIPDGMFVLHHCDNPPCCNPDHLYIGTQTDNMRDRKERDRHNAPRGSKAGPAKLTESDVLNIRKMLATSTATGVELAMRYNVTPSTISSIRLRKSWTHI